MQIMEETEEQLVVINFGADTPEPGTYGTELRTPERLQSPTTSKTPIEHGEPLESRCQMETLKPWIRKGKFAAASLPCTHSMRYPFLGGGGG